MKTSRISKWYPIYRKIQEKGKLLVFYCSDLDKINTLLSNIDPKGVFISTEIPEERMLKKIDKYI